MNEEQIDRSLLENLSHAVLGVPARCLPEDAASICIQA